MEPAFPDVSQLRLQSRPNVFLCPHCRTPHEECERFIGFSKEITFRVVNAENLSPGY